jgi:ribosomal-protein-alanine N-acetyltransferase
LAHADEAPSIARMSRTLVEHGLKWSWTEPRVEQCLRNRECLALLAVQPGYQRQGVGRQLLEWLEASARTAGIFSIRLELRANNDAARSFYERLGYREAGRKHAYYDGREDALRMLHDLAVTTASGAERQ